jgi:hypothetical protein
MLVGGGWVIDLGIITCILATRINKPLNWWRSHLPIMFRRWLAKLFPFVVIIYSVVAISMNVFSILGVNNVVLIHYIGLLAAVMFIPILLMIFGGLAHDIQRQRRIDQESEAVEITVS